MEETMTVENTQVVQAMYDAFAAGDVASVLAAMHPEIEWNEAENFPYADGNPYVGPEGVASGVFQRLVDEWEYWHLKVDELLDAGDSVVALGRYRAQNKETAREIDAQFVHVWRLRDGKAVGFQQYADTAQVAAAMPR
jgi:ketosteroid isomerase-like protein